MRRRRGGLRWFVRTTWGRAALLLGVIALVWIVTVTIAEAVFDAYPTQGEALWKGLAHLLDPGSLNDDETPAQRGIGVVQVLAGMVLLVGVALAVASELIGRGLERLGRIDPRLDLSGHVLIVGDGADATAVVRAIAPHDPTATIAILVPLDAADRLGRMRADLRDVHGGRVEIVTGDATTREGLTRACAASARSIIALSPPGGGDDAADVAVLETGTAIADLLTDEGRIGVPVALDIRRGENVDALSGRLPPGFDPLVRDRSLGGLIALAISTPTFAGILGAAGDAEGSVIRTAPIDGGSATGFGELRGRFDRCIPLGLARRGADGRFHARYALDPHEPPATDERVIVLAGSPTAALTGGAPGPADPPPDVATIVPVGPGRLDLLVIGWSAACEALAEMVAQIPPERIHAVVLAPPGAAAAPPFTVHTGDASDPGTLARMMAMRPTVVLIASTDPDGADADARATLTALRAVRADPTGTAPILVEQQIQRPAAVLRSAGDRVHVLSAPAIATQRAALAAADPATLAAQEGMVDPGLRVSDERYEPADRRSTTLGALAAALASERAVPLAVAREGAPVEADDMAALEVRPGDHLLVLRPVGPAATPTPS